jgi:hypothetical protein
MKLHVVGIDLGKTVFHLVGLDSTGRVVIRKKCSRTQLLVFTAGFHANQLHLQIRKPGKRNLRAHRFCHLQPGPYEVNY